MAAFVIGIGIIVIWAVNRSLILSQPTVAFVVTILAIVFALVVIGVGINGRPSGVLIDNRNRISLAKFQMVMWTVLVIATLIVIASHNLALNQNDLPLDFTIPPELLAAMGIAAGSFVSSPLILSLKTGSLPTQRDARMADADATGAAGPAFAGKVFARDNPKGAAWIDMLVGEEVGNVSAPDLGKIQQLFISILLVAIYGFSVKNELLRSATDTLTALPALNQNFVWLLAVSHASYLAYKAAPQTSTGQSDLGQGAPAPPVGQPQAGNAAPANGGA